MAIWSILWPFGIFLPVLVFLKRKNLATLVAIIVRAFEMQRQRSGFTLLRETMRNGNPIRRLDTNAITRVARFLLVQHTKTVENIPNAYIIYQMSTKYTKWP
jgi:hypothetical protein